jgi:hypothetical protein
MTVKLTSRRVGMASVPPSSRRPRGAPNEVEGVAEAGGGCRMSVSAPITSSCAPVSGADVLLALPPPLAPVLLPSQLTSITLVNTTPQA